MEPHSAKWPNNLSTAEARGYQQICSSNGKVLVIAFDQRNAMRTLLADNEEARKRITDMDLGEVKADLVRYLGNNAPALLLDPICALPKVVDEGILARDVGLVIGLDASGWETDGKSSRRANQVPGMNPRRVRQLGGTAAKILVWMRPDRDGANGYAKQIIKQLSSEYTAEDLLLVVEILVFKLPEETPEDYKAKKSSLIVDSARIAANSGAKVLKLQYPGSAESCAKITADLKGIPWAVLSEGVNHETFLEQLRIAVANGASGAIAGRALWKDCISLDPDIRREKLEKLAVPRLREVQGVLK